MIKNFLRIAWRGLLNNRFYAAINIIGLSTGIAFTLLIAAYVWSELQVNAQLKDPSRQYIIQSKWKDPNQGVGFTSMGLMAKALREQYPSLIANYYRWDGITSVVSHGNKTFREGLQVCDSTMFAMYGFQLLHGDENTAFDHPFAVVITGDKAIKYFGKTDVIGKTLTIESFGGTKRDFNISGVMDKPHKNSVINITDDNDNGFFISTRDITFFGRSIDNWQTPYIVNYVELAPGADPKAVERAMVQLLKQNTPPEVANNLTPFITSLKDYYLSANNGLVKKLLYALSAIALFILVMAIINFINLSINRSVKRMREIGIRKVLGGMKQQLVFQFLIESILLVFMSSIVALGIYLVTKDIVGSILGEPLPGLGAAPAYLAGFLGTLIVVVGITAGIYPAFVLSSFKPVESLKGKLTSVKENVWLRKSLVGFQFGIAAIVFVGAIVISQQVKLFFSKDLGYDKEYIVTAMVPRNWSAEGVKKMEQIRDRLSEVPQVSNVSLSYEMPNGNNAAAFGVYRVGWDASTAVQGSSFYTDEHYASTYGIPMAAGSFYTPAGAVTDTLKIVINQKMASALGWHDPSEAVGQQVMNRGDQRIFTVAGVTKDFHFDAMQQSVQPAIFFNVKTFTFFRMLSFKLKPGDMPGSLAALGKKWTEVMPGAPFEYVFLDDSIRQLYKTELQLQKASYVGTSLSFVIVLLGMVGLIALSVQRRTKEIGIRKVLGSSVGNIIGLFMKDMAGAILAGAIVACPIAWYIMDKWLGDYANRIELTPIPFIIAIVVLWALTAILVVMQTIRTALMNPVKSLRTD